MILRFSPFLTSWNLLRSGQRLLKRTPIAIPEASCLAESLKRNIPLSSHSGSSNITAQEVNTHRADAVVQSAGRGFMTQIKVASLPGSQELLGKLWWDVSASGSKGLEDSRQLYHSALLQTIISRPFVSLSTPELNSGHHTSKHKLPLSAYWEPPWVSSIYLENK